MDQTPAEAVVKLQNDDSANNLVAALMFACRRCICSAPAYIGMTHRC
jgi:hypothetical protein